jgi:hypothetical protein
VVDDVRSATKDAKERRGSALKGGLSPHSLSAAGSGRASAAEFPDLLAADSCGAPASGWSGSGGRLSATAAGADDVPVVSLAGLHPRHSSGSGSSEEEELSEGPDQAAGGDDGYGGFSLPGVASGRPTNITLAADVIEGDVSYVDDVDEGDEGGGEYGQDGEDVLPGYHGRGGMGSPLLPPTFMRGPLHLSHHVMEDIIDSMSVQTFSPEQVAAMIAGAEPQQVRGVAWAAVVGDLEYILNTHFPPLLTLDIVLCMFVSTAS